MHDGVLGRTEEIGGSSETVEHAAAHDASRVGVRVNVNLDGSVHTDDTKTTNDLGAVGDLLGAEQKLVRILVPALVEAVESIWRETDRSGGSEVEVARVKEIQERVLKNLGPYLQVLEVCTAGLYLLEEMLQAKSECKDIQQDHQQRRWQCFRYPTEWATGCLAGGRA